MEFACLCNKRFELEGENDIFPKHKDQSGETCPGSNQSAKIICQVEEENTCPLGLDASYCANCEDQPCLAEDD